MLLEYGFENYFSFREGGLIDLTLAGSVPDQIAQGRDYSTAACVKGSNASGKTNVLRAISFVCAFAAKSFQTSPESQINIEPFFNSPDPANFTLKFRQGDATYDYELAVTETHVVSEALYRTKKKKVLIVERKGDKLVCKSEFKRLTSMKLRSNASFISLAIQHEFSELQPVFNFFKTMISNVGYGGMKPDFGTDEAAAKFYSTRKELLEQVSNFIRSCDTGISSIEILSHETSSGESEHFPIFFHGADRSRPVTVHTESSGTRALFRKLAPVFIILMSGGLLVADEVDINLHPHILRKVVDLFLDPATNPNGAQLIFTTHNNEVMDTLGRYRTFLVQKSDNESFVYRLDEIPGDILRNDRPISPVYDQGRIGGVPNL